MAIKVGALESPLIPWLQHEREIITSCEPPFSFFKLTTEWEGSKPLHCVCDIMRKYGGLGKPARTLVLECLQPTEEHIGDDDALSRITGQTNLGIPIQLSFFTTPFEEFEIGEANEEDFLGYAIMKTNMHPEDHQFHVMFESVIRKPELLNNYIHCCAKFEVEVLGRNFTVEGAFFSQQNSLTNVCAHAAMKMLLNNMREQVGGPVTYEDINGILCINHVTKKLSKDGPAQAEQVGVGLREVEKVIEHYGLSCQAQDYLERTYLEYPHFIYSIVESGFPGLLVFSTEDRKTKKVVLHALTVIGHTFNSDLWTPEVEFAYFGLPGGYKYHSSSSWANNLIVQDDNFGMYYCMPINCLKKITLPSYDPFRRVRFALGILPPEVKRTGRNAEEYALKILGQIFEKMEGLTTVRWFEELRKVLVSRSTGPIFRTFLVDKTTYIAHIKEEPDWDRTTLEPQITERLEKTLPCQFWMLEITLPHLYTANRRKLGEILYAPEPESPETPWEGFLFMRLPGLVFFPNSGDPPYDVVQTDLIGHTNVLRFEPPSREW